MTTGEHDKLQFAEEILRKRRKTCINCWHGKDGHCSLYSSECVTAVFNKANDPPRWTSHENGEAWEALVWRERLND